MRMDVAIRGSFDFPFFIINILMVDRILYFAYGHNTHITEMKKRARTAKRIGRAVAPNYQLVMRNHTDIMAKDGAKTYGVLWAIEPSDIDTLNKIEGYNLHYAHAYIEILFHGKLYKAVTFVMIPSDDEGKMPSKQYINYVYSGYKQNQIPLDQLSSAVRSRMQRVRRDKNNGKDIY